MKKVILFLLISLSCFSQDEKGKEFILNNSNSNILLDLENIFNSKYISNKDIIDNFIKGTHYQQRFISNSVIFEIDRILDNKIIYKSTDNVAASRATKTNLLNTGGSSGLSLNGENMLVGVWDGGLALSTHDEFQNDNLTGSRVTMPDNNLPFPNYDDHATHVSGTIIAKGFDPNSKGMAPKAQLLSYDWNNDEGEVTTSIINNSLLISNHSYGVPVLTDAGELNVPSWFMGCYNSDAVNWDLIHYNAPYYLMVASAGNSGGDSYTGGLLAGYDKLTGEKNAKNNLVVANANPFVLANGFLVNVVINSSSSQGPSDDGRIKPDISGDGTNLYSSISTSNNAYATFSGTSMASPNVAGSLLLLQQYYNQLFPGTFMRSATLKGLACHSVFDAGTVGPDAKFGFGLLDTNASATVLTNSMGLNSTSIVKELILNQNETKTFEVTVDNIQNLKATLCWTDPAGIPKDNQLNSSTPALVNDLDIRIKKGTTEVNFPWKLQLSNVAAAAIKGDNIVDNVEKVEVNNASGTYTIEISHKGTLQGGSQAYSLIISGFDQNLSAIDFNLNKINIHPNPTTDKLFVNTSNVVVTQYEVFDLQGRLVKSDKVNNLTNFSIELNDINAGMYLVQIHSSNGISSHKIIKK